MPHPHPNCNLKILPAPPDPAATTAFNKIASPKKPATLFPVVETLYESPIGALLIVASNDGLHRIDFPNKYAAAPITSKCENNITRQLAEELDAYFAHSLNHFKTPIAARGTPFQHRVWNQLRKIPIGETASYGEIAAKIGSAKAFRAVGSANNKNPTPIIVPCHRVIGKSGKLVGFAGELWRKEWLLNHEFKLNSPS